MPLQGLLRAGDGGPASWHGCAQTAPRPRRAGLAAAWRMWATGAAEQREGRGVKSLGFGASTGRGRAVCERASVIPTGKIATLSPMTPVDPPAHLPEPAIEVWRTTIEAMAAAKTLDAGCLPAVERYATAVCRWREAERHLADEGAVLRAAKTGVPSVNVWHSIGRAAAAQITRLEAELGLVPARRSRIWQAVQPLKADGTPGKRPSLGRCGGVGRVAAQR